MPPRRGACRSDPLRAWIHALLVGVASTATAETVVLPAVEQGVFREDGSWELGQTALGLGREGHGEIRGVFVFDVSGLTGTPTGATLRLEPNLVSPDRREEVVVHGVSSDPDLLVWDSSFEGLRPALGTFWDLGTGQQLGSGRISRDARSVEIPLDGSILRVLARTDGRVALGVRVDSLRRVRPDRPAVDERVTFFPSLRPGGTRAADLVVTTEPVEAAEAPTTLHVVARARRGGTGAADAPLDSVAAALDLATPGDTVAIGPGVYAETLIMKDGVDIEGSGQDRTILDLGSELPSARCADAMLRRVFLSQDRPERTGRTPHEGPSPAPILPTGGLDCTNGASPFIHEVFIGGRGIDLEGSEAWISGSSFPQLQGIDSSPTVETSRFVTSSFHFTEAGAAPLRIERNRGHGITVSGAAPAESTIVGNFLLDVPNFLSLFDPPSGGVLVSAVGDLGLIASNTLIGTAGIRFCDPPALSVPSRDLCTTRADGGAAVLANNILAFGSPGISIDASSTVTLLHNDVYENRGRFSSTPRNYEGVPDPTGTDGNLSVDPEFEGSRLLLAEDGGGRLASTSPLIDAGTNDFVATSEDLGGLNRVLDGDADGEAVVDIGAREHLPRVRQVTIRVIGGRRVDAFGLSDVLLPSKRIDVAIFSSDTFDAPAEADHSTLQLTRWNPFRPSDGRCRVRDVDRDGRKDLLCRFPSGWLWNWTGARVEKILYLYGDTHEGERFLGTTRLTALALRRKDVR